MEIVSQLLANQGWIILFFFIVAVLYSSVGFGGGSSYLAILAFSGIVYSQVRSTALLCNIAVVTGNVILFQRAGLYNWKKVIPLVLFSVPLAFLGGYLKISQTFFFILLGITLLFAAITMWFSNRLYNTTESKSKGNTLKNAGIGGIVGFVSGMVGIGGGIFLAPFLHIDRWDVPKKIAAAASLFILVNSASGLVGQYLNPSFYVDWNLTIVLLVTVFIGGQIGSRLSNRFLSPFQLKKATAILIAYVSIRILVDNMNWF